MSLMALMQNDGGVGGGDVGGVDYQSTEGTTASTWKVDIWELRPTQTSPISRESIFLKLFFRKWVEKVIIRSSRLEKKVEVEGEAGGRQSEEKKKEISYLLKVLKKWTLTSLSFTRCLGLEWVEREIENFSPMKLRNQFWIARARLSLHIHTFQSRVTWRTNWDKQAGRQAGRQVGRQVGR